MNLKTQLEAILADKRANLLPSNIRIGKTIMGVKGTLPAPVENRVVKLFTSYEALEKDENPDIDDLAIVYGKDIVNPLINSYKEVRLPSKIVFDTPVTNYAEYRGYDYGGLFYMECSITIDMYNINVNIYGYDTGLNAHYSSDDGVTFTTEQSVLTVSTEYEFPAFTSHYGSDVDMSWFKAYNNTFSGLLKYNGYEYVNCPTQFTLSGANEILNNKCAYGTSVFTGDGSYINNIPNTDFIKRYIGDDYKYTSKTMMQNGTQVKNQTFVEKQNVNFTQLNSIDPEDCVVYGGDNWQVIEDYSNQEVFTTSWNYATSNIWQYNDKLYYAYAGFNGTLVSSSSYKAIKKFGYAVINITDNELVAHKVTTCSFDPVNRWSILSDQYDAQLQKIAYDPDTDTFYGFWYKSNNGWNGSTPFGITTYPKNGTLSNGQYTFNIGYQYRTFNNCKWDPINKMFINTISCWYSGASSYTTAMCKITTAGAVTQLFSNAEAVSLSISTYGISDYGPIIFMSNNALDTSSKYRLYNTQTNSYMNIVTSTNSYRGKAIGKDCLLVAKELDGTRYDVYKFTSSDNGLTRIVYDVGDNPIYVFKIDGKYHFAINNKLYNLEGDEIGTVPTPYSNYWIRIMETVNDELQDIFSTSYSSGTGRITVTNYRYTYEVYKDIKSFPVTGQIGIVLSGNNTNTGDYLTYKCYAFMLNEKDYTGTITPKEYNTALGTSKEILGGGINE